MESKQLSVKRLELNVLNNKCRILLKLMIIMFSQDPGKTTSKF